MERRWRDCAEPNKAEMTDAPEEWAMQANLSSPSIIFCIDPSDPLMKRIKAGQTVTYELVRGDNGQWYAIDIRLESDATEEDNFDTA
ncbi:MULTISPECIES: hypothetical protein [unclassified Pseudomonas]|uniref:hypothetical protein n=1 Tax=unclassified Pseudomonas TaxID=196821 RepID=UPI000A1EE1B7|nr:MULTISPECIES: hypothetical protein [unclassified Pseudomonas]